MSEHRWAIENLGWYVNDTLTDDDKERVRRHLGECLVCKQEWRAQQRVAEAVAAPAVLPPSDEALALLAERIDRSPGLRERWRRMLDATPRPVRLAFAVQAVVLVALLSLLTMQRAQFEQSADFRTRSASAPLSGDLRVVFSPDVAQKDIDAFVRSHDARIVAGPTPRGVYTLALAERLTNSQIDRIRAASQIVFAERPAESTPSDP